jgi:hypothetical protein
MIGFVEFLAIVKQENLPYTFSHHRNILYGTKGHMNQNFVTTALHLSP